MTNDPPNSEFNTETARLLRREARRRAAEEMNTTSPLGLEDMLNRISDEVTEEAEEKRERDAIKPPPPR